MLPTFQLAWDATSLRSLMQCPEQYNLGHVQGWRARDESVHLGFGRYAGSGLETFFRCATEEGLDHEAALRRALRTALEESWDHETGKPRLGTYEQVWYCLGKEKYKNKKGNAAKCPYSHKGKLFPGPGPAVCGECGSRTEAAKRWFPTLAGKDRYQLMRLIVWYTEEVKNGALKPVTIEREGKHTCMVEVPWTLPLTKLGDEQISLCGWFDAIKTMGEGELEEVFVGDYKTTKKSLGEAYFRQYSPNVQVDLYDIAASKLFPGGLPYRGVFIEAIQVLINGVRFGFRVYTRSAAQRAEAMDDVVYWIAQAYYFARNGVWPRNRSACAMCQFNAVCSADPAARPHILEANFERKRWNPLTRTQEAIT